MIHIKTEEDIEYLRRGGRIAAEILAELLTLVKAGKNSLQLDERARKLMQEAGCTPVFLNYQTSRYDPPFPASICVSINEEVVHGIPSASRVFQNGDVVSVDIGIGYPGENGHEYVLDTARTVVVGKASALVRKLLKTVPQALDAGIAQIKPGKYVHDISLAIQKTLQKQSLGIPSELCGHGVGYKLHEDPYVLNIITDFDSMDKVLLRPGMVLAIEPMATLGKGAIRLARDGWTYVTADRSVAAQFEDTVVVTKTGYEILTRLRQGYDGQARLGKKI